MFLEVMCKLRILLLIIVLSGCSYLSTGEGAFSVIGEIGVATTGSDTCVIKLLTDGQASSYNTRPILGAFNETFVVSSEVREYTISISCGGNLIVSREILYPGNIGVGGTINIGTIVSGA